MEATEKTFYRDLEAVVVQYSSITRRVVSEEIEL